MKPFLIPRSPDSPLPRYPDIPISRFPVYLLFLLLISCSPKIVAPPPSVTEPIYWPPPPFESRIEWVKEIRDFNDCNKNGFWHRISEIVFGEKQIRMIRPQALLVDQSQRLFVVDTGAGLVHWLDMKTNKYRFFPDHDDGVILESPVGVAQDGSDYLYITDSKAGTVLRYDLNKQSFQPFLPYKLKRPTGIVFNPVFNLLYVAETGTHQIVALDLAGREKYRFGGRGDEVGLLNYPTHITVDGKGQLIVTDSLNARVQIFSADGHFLGSFGQPGDTSGTFAKPKGVGVDSEDHIYVADALFDAVQIFDNSGRLLLEFGKSGHQPGEFWLPSGLFIDNNDFIYVADTYNRRIQVFRYITSGERVIGLSGYRVIGLSGYRVIGGSGDRGIR